MLGASGVYRIYASCFDIIRFTCLVGCIWHWCDDNIVEGMEAKKILENDSGRSGGYDGCYSAL